MGTYRKSKLLLKFRSFLSNTSIYLFRFFSFHSVPSVSFHGTRRMKIVIKQLLYQTVQCDSYLFLCFAFNSREKNV